MISGPSTAGMRETSSRRIVISGWLSIARVTSAENRSAVDRERGAGRHARDVRRAHHQRAEPPHLLFEETDGVIEFVAAEGIAADQFRQAVRLVDGGRTDRPHLVKSDRNTVRRGLPRSFAAREAASDDVDHVNFQLPTTNYQQLPIGSWQLEVGSCAKRSDWRKLL